MEDLRFFIAEGDRIVGPLSDDEIARRLDDGELSMNATLRLAGTDLWAPLLAWAPFTGKIGVFELPEPPDEDDADTLRSPIPGVVEGGIADAAGERRARLRAQVSTCTPEVFDALSFVLSDARGVYGPMSGAQVRGGLEEGRLSDAKACTLACPSLWRPVSWFFRRGTLDSVGAVSVGAVSVGRDLESDRHPSEAAGSESKRTSPALSFAEPELTRCPTCLESVPISDLCSECGEPMNGAPTSRPASVADDQIGDSWLKMHWRPLVTLGAIASLICVGIMLRYLAPGRFYQERANPRPAAVTPTCENACWPGESCQLGACVWNAPKDVGHVGDSPMVAGPYQLPADVSDVLPLDDDRFAVALLAGTQIRNAKTGEVQSLVSEAPQSRRLYRVGDALYAAGPHGLYVIDTQTTRLLKTLELGAIVGDVSFGANDHRALVSLPGANAIAVVETNFHAEVDRIRFIGDAVGPVGADDTGKRALTTTGRIPLPGVRQPSEGAVYAFDPSRLASEQDRVRTSMLGNPVSVLITPDGERGYVVLRKKGELVQLGWQPSGAVRIDARIETCKQPEQIELLRRDRRAVVRCNQGRALEVFDLVKSELVHHVPLSARAQDLAVSPDGRQAVVALPNAPEGALAIVDLATYDVRLVQLAGPPSRVRYTPSGSGVLVLSDQTKGAWFIR